MLKVRITMTETGYPVDIDLARKIYGRTVNLAPEAGWFWIGATPAAAASMRRHGHRAVGELTTTWFPPEDGRSEAEVPVIGSTEDTQIRLREAGF
jgi:hypothetical protein